MIILPLDPHLVDAAVEFEELGYLRTIDSVVEIRLIGHTIGLISNIISVVEYIYMQGGTVFFSLYLLGRQVLAWFAPNTLTIAASYIPSL